MITGGGGGLGVYGAAGVKQRKLSDQSTGTECVHGLLDEPSYAKVLQFGMCVILWRVV